MFHCSQIKLLGYITLVAKQLPLPSSPFQNSIGTPNLSETKASYPPDEKEFLSSSFDTAPVCGDACNLSSAMSYIHQNFLRNTFDIVDIGKLLQGTWSFHDKKNC